MRLTFAGTLLLATAAAASAGECPTAKIEAALTAPLGKLKMTEREVSDIQSTEGGIWRIYSVANGTAQTVLRLDGGETGMSERRLSVVDRNAYGISRHPSRLSATRLP